MTVVRPGLRRTVRACTAAALGVVAGMALIIACVTGLRSGALPFRAWPATVRPAAEPAAVLTVPPPVATRRARTGGMAAPLYTAPRVLRRAPLVGPLAGVTPTVPAAPRARGRDAAGRG